MKTILLFMIRIYQKIAPFPNYCRFTPSCSGYMYQSIEKYGSFKGIYKGIKRIARCHPWAQGGFDPVK